MLGIEFFISNVKFLSEINDISNKWYHIFRINSIQFHWNILIVWKSCEMKRLKFKNISGIDSFKSEMEGSGFTIYIF